MVGAVIGDLAAWTWEHDRSCFYERLVSRDARLSGYGMLPIVMWRMINDGRLINKNRLYVLCGKALKHARPAGIAIPDTWQAWGCCNYEQPIPFDLKIAMISAAFIDSGYQSEQRHQQFDWVSFFHGGKQEYYALYMMTVLRRLNEGATKDEAITDIPGCVLNYYPSGSRHHWKDFLEYITFAWRCFYYSWDFTSALHNAAKCPANHHLAMILTGAFAEAMYGCCYSMTKKKFGGRYEYIQIPETVPEEYKEELNQIRRYEYDHRFFFKKNDALTNVERLVWKDIENSYSGLRIDVEAKNRILRAFHTDWDNRYGLYLDNGWIYVYRSHCLLLRFQLESHDQRLYKIVRLQISDESVAGVDDLMEALQSLKLH